MGEFVLLFVLLLLSGFFSGSEIALFSLGPEKISALKKQTVKKKARQRILRLETLKADPQKLLVTILIGNNVVNVSSSALATIMATKFAEESGFGGNEAVVIGLVTGVMTFLLLLFGEITPKSLAHKHAVKCSLFVAPFLSVMQIILSPIVIPLSKFVKQVSGDQDNKHGLTEDELKAALELSQLEGKIDSDEKEWVEKILEFGEHTVENVMTPRSKISAFEDTMNIEEALVEIREEKFSRIPVYHEELEQITGILTIHGIIEKMSEPDFSKLKVANLRLNKPYKIPVTMKIDKLLNEFQQEQTHMALVYDEHGGLVGLITLEDVLEEIFGEIHDEQDEERLEIRQSGKTTFTAGSETELEQLEDFVKEKLNGVTPEFWPWELEDENKSIGLFILEKLEKFPQVDEVLELKSRDAKFVFVITKCEDDRILEVEFSVL
jgi:CBS domain containing-hemolysin-like protein